MVENLITLFPSTSTVFTSNGLGTLAEAISCTVTEERNGMYELSMRYPITGKRYHDITLRKIIVTKPNPYDSPQAFRIYRISKPISGVVTIDAEHISYDLSGLPVTPFQASGIQNAFTKLSESIVGTHPFHFHTDRTTDSTMETYAPMSARSVLGGTEGSFLDVYGGEFEFDNFSVTLHNDRGSNRGVVIEYGKNLTDVTQEEHCAEVYTGIYPYWYYEDADGYILKTLPEKIINAEGTYSFERILPVDFSHVISNAPTDDTLRSLAVAYMDVNEIGIPKVSIEVSFISLDGIDETELSALREVHLCDTVTVRFRELGVEATAKCVRTVYDVLKNRYDKVDLGNVKSTLAARIAEQGEEISNLPTQVQVLTSNTNAKDYSDGNLANTASELNESIGEVSDRVGEIGGTLYSGSAISGSITLTGAAKMGFLVIAGIPSYDIDLTTITIPVGMITFTDTTYQFGSGATYTTFKVRRAANNKDIILTYDAGGDIRHVYGI